MNRLEEIKKRSIEELRPGVVPWRPIFSRGSSGEEPLIQEMEAAEKSQGRKKERDPWELSDDARRVLERIIRRPEETIAERMLGLDMDVNREGRARKLLLGRGLIQEVGQIGKNKFFWITEKGRAWAKERKVSVPKFKSGPFHEVIRRRAQKVWATTDPEVRFKKSPVYNGVQPDDLGFYRDGRIVPLQVSVANGAANEAKALLRLAEHPSVSWALMVAANDGKARAIENALLEETAYLGDEGRRLLEKIIIEDAKNVMKGEISWTSVV
jgi:hypothetical protein